MALQSFYFFIQMANHFNPFIGIDAGLSLRCDKWPLIKILLLEGLLLLNDLFDIAVRDKVRYCMIFK